jgi:hypothetical protein
MEYEMSGGYESITVDDTPIGLTVAKIAGAGRATSIHLSVEGYNIRYRADGGDPSDTVGVLMSAGNEYSFSGRQILNNLRFHRVTSAATLNVQYFHGG